MRCAMRSKALPATMDHVPSSSTKDLVATILLGIHSASTMGETM
ncbi:hypothetical protein HMPREF1556_00850 [Porphyromonas sp. oral taxon 278 str. W7784]|nr:hypothetical protein HMPREF1556_00850 [Porphyromonas sp. oral taxon 278 str. W7784]